MRLEMLIVLCEQAVAMLAVTVLLFSYFPPPGYTIENAEEDEVEEADE